MKIYVIILFALSLLMTQTVTAQTVDGVLDKSMKDFVDAEFKKNNLEVTSPLGIQRKKLFYSLMALKRNSDGTFVNEKALQTLQKAIEENQKNIIIQQYQDAANKVSALLPIEPVVSSSSRNSSYAQNKSTSVTAKNPCTKCSKGFEIRDFNESTRQYSNFRRETKIGFILCDMCQGTKKMSVTAGSNYKGRGCTSCQNTGWRKCDMSSSGH